MSETTVFYRTKRQLFLTIFSGVMLTVGSYLNFVDWQVGGRTFPLVLGIVFGIWAVFVWLNIMRRKTFGHVGPDGIFVRRPLREFSIPWDALVWATMEPGARVTVIAYRLSGEDRERYSGYVAKTIGPDGVAALQAAITTYRPDLPSRAQENT